MPVRRIVAGALLLGSAAGRAVAGPSEFFERYRDCVVAVSYSVETSVMHEVREMGGRDVGILVTPDLVILNGSPVTSSATGAQPHGFRVRFTSGLEVRAEYLGRDDFANVAVLRLQGAPPPGVRPLQFRDRPRLQVGDRVYALGLLPENLDPMVELHCGHVVARVERPKPFLLTDLPVAEALGGPVFDESGHVAGVLSELGDSGPGFVSGFGAGEGANTGLVLDPETLARLVAAPPRKGEMRRAWLGITLQALDHDKAEYWGLGNTTGVIVNSVVAGSPAEVAGLRSGDVVVSLNGAPVPVSQEEHVPIFVEQVGSAGVGSKLQLGVVRRGQRLEVAVQLVAAPKSRLDAENYHSSEFDLTVRELVFQDYRAFELKPDVKGVLVSKVEEGGWAGVGGLEIGDIIQKVDDQEIDGPGAVKQILEDAVRTHKRKLVFFVQRSGRTQFVTVQPNWTGES